MNNLYTYFGDGGSGATIGGKVPVRRLLPDNDGDADASSDSASGNEVSACRSAAPSSAKKSKRTLGENTWKRWLAKHDWTIRNPYGTIACRRCRDAGLKNKWTAGDGQKCPAKTGWRLEYLDNHANSHVIKKVAHIEVAQQDMQVARARAVEVASPAYVAIMKNVLFCIQNEKPIKFASDLHTLVKEQLSTSGAKVSLPDKHQSNFSTYQFLQAMNKVVTDDERQELQGSRVMGIQIDESTDITSSKILIIYTQHFSDSANDSVLRFRAARQLTACDAAAITASITEYFASLGVDLGSKLVYFTSDGASVMLGANNGVAAKLRQHLRNDSMISMHCVCHREALALKDAYQSIEFFEQLEAQVRSLISYVHTSKVAAQLKELATIIGMHVRYIPRLYAIRCLSRHDVMKKLAENVPLLQVYFEDLGTRHPAAKGFRRMMTDRRFLLTLFYVADILEPLARLNKTFQQTGYHPFDVPALVSGKIRYLKTHYGPDNDAVGGANVQLIESDAITVRAPGRSETSDEEVTVMVKDHVCQLMRRIAANLESRFFDNSGILIDSRIFAPPEPGMSSQMMVGFGCGVIRRLAVHFGFLNVDRDECLQEWQEFKPDAKSSGLWAKGWRCVLKSLIGQRVTFPNLSIVAEALYILCAENATVERGFSASNRLKNKTRNHLQAPTVEMLLRLYLNADNWSTFNFNAAYNNWLKTARRKRYATGGGGSTTTTTSSQNVSTGDDDEMDEEMLEGFVSDEGEAGDYGALL